MNDFYKYSSQDWHFRLFHLLRSTRSTMQLPVIWERFPSIRQTHSIIDDKLNNCKTSIKNLLIVKNCARWGMNEGDKEWETLKENWRFYRGLNAVRECRSQQTHTTTATKFSSFIPIQLCHFAEHNHSRFGGRYCYYCLFLLLFKLFDAIDSEEQGVEIVCSTQKLYAKRIEWHLKMRCTRIDAI